jgi:hypothetical protein
MQKDFADSNPVINQNNSSNDLSSNEHSKIDEDLVISNTSENQRLENSRGGGGGGASISSPSTMLTTSNASGSLNTNNVSGVGLPVGSGAYVNPLSLRDSDQSMNTASLGLK